MLGYNHNQPATGRIVRPLMTLSLAFAALCAAPCAFALDTGDIVITSLKGEVHVVMGGSERAVRPGAVLELPATVRTGTDGAIELRQGATTVSVGPDTLLEFPAQEKRGGPIDRVVQPRGNAFYGIGKRAGRKLRVETPYLVGVIKGTQFNVAAQDDSTTIALFEGHLEVRASDESDVVDLDAGEIAIRRRNDVTISVLRLNAARGDARRNPELAARQQADSSATNSSAVTARSDDSSAQPRVDAPTTVDVVAASVVTTAPEPGRVADALAETSPDVTAKAAVDLTTESRTVTTTSVDIGGVSADVGASASIDVPAGAVAASNDVAVAAGPVTADVGTSAAIDVPAGTVDVAVGGAVAATDAVTIDTSVSAAADVPAGTLDVSVDSSVASTDIDAAVGVDAGTSNVGADVGVAGVNVGVDAGTSGVGLDVGLSTDNSGSLLGGLGGLLGGRKRN